MWRKKLLVWNIVIKNYLLYEVSLLQYTIYAPILTHTQLHASHLTSLLTFTVFVFTILHLTYCCRAKTTKKATINESLTIHCFLHEKIAVCFSFTFFLPYFTSIQLNSTKHFSLFVCMLCLAVLIRKINYDDDMCCRNACFYAFCFCMQPNKYTIQSCVQIYAQLCWFPVCI